MDCQQCWRATPTLAAAPVSCDALPADSTTALPAPLRFLPLHSQTNKSSDLSPTSSPLDIASDLLEAPAFPVLPNKATPASPMNNVKPWSQVLGVTAEPASITLDDIREAQSLDDNLQPVIQSLQKGVKPHRVVCKITQKRHAYSSRSGICSSSKIASCISTITTLMAPLSTYKLYCLPSFGAHMSSVCTPTLDILAGQRPVCR